MSHDLYRLYGEDELRGDGYPVEWHAAIKFNVREQAGNRCVRCGHPYRTGEHGRGDWTPCDEECRHGGPLRAGVEPLNVDTAGEGVRVVAWLVERGSLPTGTIVEAAWRILTVHHLDGDKANCRWWNLAPLCQRCHLTIQGRVVMARIWPWEHSEWFRPYVAGYYAHAYLGEDLNREEVEARLDELLDLERVA
jgi:hypothetical protein